MIKAGTTKKIGTVAGIVLGCMITVWICSHRSYPLINDWAFLGRDIKDIKQKYNTFEQYVTREDGSGSIHHSGVSSPRSCLLTLCAFSKAAPISVKSFPFSSYSFHIRFSHRFQYIPTQKKNQLDTVKIHVIINVDTVKIQMEEQKIETKELKPKVHHTPGGSRVFHKRQVRL